MHNERAPSYDALAPPEVVFHSSSTTPAEAHAINSHFAIKIYGIVHSLPKPAEADPAQIEKAYQASAEMVDTLDPARGDVLFAEGMGHTGPDNYSFLMQYPAEQHRDLLARERAEQTIDPQLYAMSLAAAKGIPIVPADIHRDAIPFFGEQVGEPVPQGFSPEWKHFPLFQLYRNHQAASTVKDYALDALPSLNGQIPTYAVVLGPAHADSQKADNAGVYSTLSDSFNTMGLHSETHILPSPFIQLP